MVVPKIPVLFESALDDKQLKSCIHAIIMFFEWRREDNSSIQRRILLEFNCRIDISGELGLRGVKGRRRRSGRV